MDGVGARGEFGRRREKQQLKPNRSRRIRARGYVGLGSRADPTSERAWAPSKPRQAQCGGDLELGCVGEFRLIIPRKKKKKKRGI